MMKNGARFQGASLTLIVAVGQFYVGTDVLGQTRAASPNSGPAAVVASPRPSVEQQSAPGAKRDPAVEDGGALKGSQIVARVGDKDVTAAELRTAIQQLDIRQQAALANDPALLAQTVRSILATQLVLKEAFAKNWDQQPTITVQLSHLRDNLISESYLQSVTTPPDTYPSEADIKAFYDANAQALVQPRRYRLGQIVIPVAKDADKSAQDSAQRKVDDIVKKLKQPGADFAALVHLSSEDSTAAERDSDIGWVNEPDLRVELRGSVSGLQKSGVSEPIKLEDGWHIIKLLDIEAARPRSLDEVRGALVQKLRSERALANRRAYVQDLLKQSPPVLNELALSQLLPKMEAPASK
jgi:parvulin-like peptidyl-prolyl isomerase